ncbi:hypothetical protein HY857_02320 [Candidatus Saccharibacteria bacterium]|nr:hypothetical protein [Candidatus Saccharibacteria bacterium]
MSTPESNDLNPEFEQFENPQGEYPPVDLRRPLVYRHRRLVRTADEVGSPWSTRVKHGDTDKIVELGDIELAPGDEEGTLYARIHETVDRHRTGTVIAAGTFTVAAVLAILGGIYKRGRQNK